MATHDVIRDGPQIWTLKVSVERDEDDRSLQAASLLCHIPLKLISKQLDQSRLLVLENLENRIASFF